MSKVSRNLLEGKNFSTIGEDGERKRVTGPKTIKVTEAQAKAFASHFEVAGAKDPEAEAAAAKAKAVEAAEAAVTKAKAGVTAAASGNAQAKENAAKALKDAEDALAALKG